MHNKTKQLTDKRKVTVFFNDDNSFKKLIHTYLVKGDNRRSVSENFNNLSKELQMIVIDMQEEEVSPLEQLTEILNNHKADIQELKELRDNASTDEFKKAYQDKVTEQVKIYNDIVSKF